MIAGEKADRAMPVSKDHPRRLLAVASGGGHWVELLRLSPVFEKHDVAFVTVNDSYRTQVHGHRFYRVNDASRWNKIGLIILALRLAFIVWKEKPEVIISTGAAPGYFAIWLGSFVGARTIWLDSIANVDRLSLSGQLSGKYAHLWLTQWPHLAAPEGPHYHGAVL